VPDLGEFAHCAGGCVRLQGLLDSAPDFLKE